MQEDWKPKVGMTFDNYDDAWRFWVDYSGRIGFGARKEYRHLRKDGSTSSCRLVCCKEGLRKADKRDFKIVNSKPETRTDCQARLGLKGKKGKLTVFEFVEEHNHILQLPKTTRNALLFHMDLDKGNGTENSCLEESTSIFDGVEVEEPYVGMEFDSEGAAKKIYVEYARQVGFVVRIMQRRRSGIDGKTLACRLGCNKQGFSPTNKGSLGAENKPRPSAREGCKATILMKLEKSGKWVVTRFVKDHNHPLMANANEFSTEDDKDEKIAELTMELERQDQLCAAYREKLLGFIKNVEVQTKELSTNIQVIVENVRRAESEMQKYSQNRKPWCLTRVYK